MTDLSLPMLQRAEDKFYDDLKLGERHPNTRITFCISDAHCMAADQSSSRAALQVHSLPALRSAAHARQRGDDTSASMNSLPGGSADVKQATPER